MRYNEGNIEELGLLVCSARLEAGLSQQELASRVGCREQWIVWLEAGRLGQVNAKTLGRLTKQLNLCAVEVDWLSGGMLEGWYPSLVTWFRQHQLSAKAALVERHALVRQLQSGRQNCGLVGVGGRA